MSIAEMQGNVPLEESKVKWGAIRVSRLEITGLDKDARQRWRTLCEMCQQIENTLWQEWLVWHVNQGTRDILAAWLEACREWHETDKKKRPKKKPQLTAKPIEKPLDHHLWRIISERFANCNARTLSLIQNAWRRTLTTRKSANGNLSGWINILMNRESIPSFKNPLPIPFDRQNSKLIPPEPGGNHKLQLRLWRLSTEKNRSPSVVDTVEMWTKGRKRNSQSQILWRCESGEYKFCGSKIVFKKGKVFALICYRMPRKTQWFDTSRIAVVAPHTDHPLRMKLGPRFYRRPGGYGRDVAAIRRQVMSQLTSRRHGYRNAGSSNKGHGRRRAMHGVAKLKNRWKDFVKRWNHQQSRDIVQQCIDQGIGTLVWFGPTDANRDHLFLSRAGKHDFIRESSSWDYAQLQSMLAFKCDQEGIAFEAR